MSTFTSTLPDDLLARLSDAAKELALPKNKLIENALRIYLEQLKKAEYVKSYSRMDKDADILLMVEEGMSEYYIQLQEE
jgi:metal-responsive CopG/Arc/MetJ family transcriptional regulator